MNYKNIVIAIDDSDTSRHALDEAIQLCRALKAELHVLHIVDETVFNQVDGYVEFEGLWDAYKSSGQALLDKAKLVLESAAIPFTTQLIELKPYSERLSEKIISEARALSADLLIIGTHGRRGFSRFFLGSVAENVVRIASLPVMLVRGTSQPK